MWSGMHTAISGTVMGRLLASGPMPRPVACSKSTTLKSGIRSRLPALRCRSRAVLIAVWNLRRAHADCPHLRKTARIGALEPGYHLLAQLAAQVEGATRILGARKAAQFD